MSPRFASLALAVATCLGMPLLGCGGKIPETRFYQLAEPAAAPANGTLDIVMEPFSSETAYDDERIVYRTNPYRLDYYQYHRWSAPPGVIVGNYFEAALERSGRFRSVVRELQDGAPVVLTGRVVAIEEVDASKQKWLGRVVLELRLADSRSGATIWTQQFEEREPLPVQTPEGLARALSTAMGRIAAKAVPAIAAHADRVAQEHAANPTMAKQAPAR